MSILETVQPGNVLYQIGAYDLPTAEAQVRDLDAIVEKLNTTFQQELKDEVEAENFFLN